MLLYTIYTNYNHKLLAKIRKPELFWAEYKRLVSRKDSKISQKRKNEKMSWWYIYTLIQVN